MAGKRTARALMRVSGREPTPTIGARITFWRQRAELTQARIATDCGVTASTVCQWESGATVPTVGNLLAVSRALGIGPREFFGPLTPRQRRASP